jgi:hypothetical protein
MCKVEFREKGTGEEGKQAQSMIHRMNDAVGERGQGLPCPPLLTSRIRFANSIMNGFSLLLQATRL